MLGIAFLFCFAIPVSFCMVLALLALITLGLVPPAILAGGTATVGIFMITVTPLVGGGLAIAFSGIGITLFTILGLGAFATLAIGGFIVIGGGFVITSGGAIFGGVLLGFGAIGIVGVGFVGIIFVAGGTVFIIYATKAGVFILMIPTVDLVAALATAGVGGVILLILQIGGMAIPIPFLP